MEGYLKYRLGMECSTAGWRYLLWFAGICVVAYVYWLHPDVCSTGVLPWLTWLGAIGLDGCLRDIMTCIVRPTVRMQGCPDIIYILWGLVGTLLPLHLILLGNA